MRKLLTIALLMFVLISCENNRIAYIENAKVFEAFNATKEIQERNNEILIPKRNQIDSLRILLINYENQMNDKDLSPKNNQKLVDHYLVLREKYDKDELAYNKLMEELNYNTSYKIWEQINLYLKEYGELNNFDMIHGASGDGNLMYAKEKMNITDEVIEFINLKYDGE